MCHFDKTTGWADAGRQRLAGALGVVRLSASTADPLLFALSKPPGCWLANQPQETTGARTVATWIVEAIRVDGMGLMKAVWERARRRLLFDPCGAS